MMVISGAKVSASISHVTKILLSYLTICDFTFVIEKSRWPPWDKRSYALLEFFIF